MALYDMGQLRPRLLPVVGVGGIMIALAFARGSIYVYLDRNQGTLGWTLFQIGTIDLCFDGAFPLAILARTLVTAAMLCLLKRPAGQPLVKAEVVAAGE